MTNKDLCLQSRLMRQGAFVYCLEEQTCFDQFREVVLQIYGSNQFCNALWCCVWYSEWFLSVLVSVLACATLAGVLCAFLVPRQLEMKVIGVETQAVSINTTITSMSLLLQTEFSVYNKNFVSAYSQNATVTAYWSDQIKGVNTTIMSATIGGRKSHAIFANVTATFIEPFLVSYCDGPSPTHIIYMQFVATLQFRLMAQNQQLTNTYYSAIKCADIDI
ncbi:transmembrane protein 106B-like [Diadema antillarum]|uniref:transmembrane protein 106B-like n=1 Tax=Diadema antillarum TaxID=105358 RepID=UPI003A83F0A5